MCRILAKFWSTEKCVPSVLHRRSGYSGSTRNTEYHVSSVSGAIYSVKPINYFIAFMLKSDGYRMSLYK